MKRKFLFAVVCTLTTCLLSCEKGDTDTSLRITVVDSSQQGQQNGIPGATVKLYANDNDMYNMTAQIGQTLTTGADGTVAFDGLEAGRTYSFRIEKECRNNLLWSFPNNHSLTVPLIPGEQTYIRPFIMPVAAVLKFVNNTTITYNVDISIDSTYSVGPDKTYYCHTWPGDYWIRIFNLNDPYYFRDSVLTILCRDTAIISFN